MIAQAEGDCPDGWMDIWGIYVAPGEQCERGGWLRVCRTYWEGYNDPLACPDVSQPVVFVDGSCTYIRYCTQATWWQTYRTDPWVSSPDCSPNPYCCRHLAPPCPNHP